ncbi:hypothetical protein CERSUDRAFT_96675 [Gelatoporia subvermispora B]|uniref:Uncharacterized protein n=1 Tax=Ceriporiopsis subvermispora (strain B) TaxID=914234 RepID=M2QET0_CERS8|nr:hypothetical protein CERSUDRAFT_96675 [Gelatoporia subvermispora B]
MSGGKRRYETGNVRLLELLYDEDVGDVGAPKVQAVPPRPDAAARDTFGVSYSWLDGTALLRHKQPMIRDARE